MSTFALVEGSDLSSHECMKERPLQCKDKASLEQRPKRFNLLSQPVEIGEIGDPPTLNSGMSSLSYTYLIACVDIGLVIH